MILHYLQTSMVFHKVSECSGIDGVRDTIVTEGCCALCLFVPPREHWRLLCYFAQTAFGQSWHLNQAVYIGKAAPWHIVSLFTVEINSFIESSLLLGLFSVAYWSAGEWTYNKQLNAFRSHIGCASSDNYRLVWRHVGKIAWKSVVNKLHSSTFTLHLCIWQTLLSNVIGIGAGIFTSYFFLNMFSAYLKNICMKCSMHNLSTFLLWNNIYCVSKALYIFELNWKCFSSGLYIKH